MPQLDDNHFRLWKTQIIPLIYDWFANHNLTWPTQSCRWGPKISENNFKTNHRIYISEQTDNSEPQKLVVATADVCKSRVASAETVIGWNEFSKSPYVKEQLVLFHPGEVNKIREVPQHPHIICTHTDAPEVYVWNLDKQPPRSRSDYVKDKKPGPKPSVADLILTGHTDTAQFPLATCSSRPCVASGGQDTQVLVWDLQDSMESLLAGSKEGSKAPTLDARVTFTGHSDTVEDVVFHPASHEELASVGDDHLLLFWDSRTGTDPTKRVEKAHADHDIQCVDWSALAPELLVTGAADGSMKVWDTRKLGSAKDTLFTFKSHEQGILRVEWSPHTKNALASGGEDRMLLVWHLDKTASTDPAEPKRQKGVAPPPPPQLLFTHAGHRNGRVVDFQWHPSDPWTFLSVSDDTAEEDDDAGGGGTLQMWRVSDLVTSPQKEMLEELETYKDTILHGDKPPVKRERAATPPATKAPPSSAKAASGSKNATPEPRKSKPASTPKTEDALRPTPEEEMPPADDEAPVPAPAPTPVAKEGTEEASRESTGAAEEAAIGTTGAVEEAVKGTTGAAEEKAAGTAEAVVEEAAEPAAVVAAVGAAAEQAQASGPSDTPMEDAPEGAATEAAAAAGADTTGHVPENAPTAQAAAAAPGSDVGMEAVEEGTTAGAVAMDTGAQDGNDKPQGVAEAEAMDS